MSDKETPKKTTKKSKTTKPVEGLVRPGDKGYPTKLAEMLGRW